jgi:hypothetical protein
LCSPPSSGLAGGVQAGTDSAGAGAGAGFFGAAFRFGAAFLAAFAGAFLAAFFADFLAADLTVFFFLRAGAAFFLLDFFFAFDFFAMIDPPDRAANKENLIGPKGSPKRTGFTHKHERAPV